MCKVYVLTKTTGEWEDTYTSCECVCLSHSEAFAEKERREKLYNSLDLKREDWWELLDELYDYEEEGTLYGTLDEFGNFSCNNEDCNQVKTTCLQLKNEFLNYITLKKKLKE